MANFYKNFTKASHEAKRLGLEYAGFGKWGRKDSTGKVHPSYMTTSSGALVPIKSSSKPSSKSKSPIKSSAYKDKTETPQHKHGMDLEKVYKKLPDTNFAKVTGIKLPQKPIVLGWGTQGKVFYTGQSDKILKITGDKSEAKVSSILQGKELDGIWKVHGAYRSNRMKGVYFIVGEPLKINHAKAKTIFTELKAAFELMGQDQEKARDCENYREQVVLNKIKGFVSADAYRIARGMHNLDKLGISYPDLWEQNIMFGDRGAVIVDIGYSDSKGEDKMGLIENTVGFPTNAYAFDFDKTLIHGNLRKPHKVRKLPLFDKFKELVASGAPVYIVTGRHPNNIPSMHQYLLTQGINMPIDKIHATGTTDSDSTPAAKGEVLKNIVNNHGEVHFWDDNEANINHASTLMGVKANLVKPNE